MMPLQWRDVLEWIFLAVSSMAVLKANQVLGPEYQRTLLFAVVLLAVLKTGYYLMETLWTLIQATNEDVAYHKFLILVAYNMAEITVSFAIDFYCLYRVDAGSFDGIDPALDTPSLLFECFYFSVLNFSFFGYGDITPQHIPAKAVMLLEVITAFSTVIFLLSDFISIKESIRRRDGSDGSAKPPSPSNP
jgi:hypothetical protein